MLAGDGIGREVMPLALEMVEAAGRAYGFAVRFTERDWSCERFMRAGAMMPADGIEQLAEEDAILLGAVGDPRVPDAVSLWGLLMPIRHAFDQYVNLRPAVLLPGVRSPLRDTGDGIDLLVVRENSEGEYSEIGGRFGRGTPAEFALQESVFTRRGVERIVTYAAARAEDRRGGLVSVTKSNGIVHSMPFWDEVVTEVVARYPGVSARSMYLDALAARLVTHPGEFDVLVGSNLFGDILSDLAAAVIGSLGLAPSANLDPSGAHPSMFEPVHGSAPDIAGLGIANPIAQIWSAAMMLDHLGERGAAEAILDAIRRTLVESDLRTPDLGGTASTRELADGIAEAFVGDQSP